MHAVPASLRICLALAFCACGGETSGEGDGGVMGDGGPATSANGLPLSDGGVAPPASADSFIAFQRDFQGFTAWNRFELGSHEGVGDSTIHTKGKRTVYVNTLPASGAGSFATGTIIVKTMETGEIFALVKRGGEYNKNGARGWEWFELGPSGSEFVIVWRGITPPAGFCYGGIVGGACNDCHMAFAGNDFVGAALLDLTKF
jgi:hypothetical protein